jgi:hypothetical protein
MAIRRWLPALAGGDANHSLKWSWREKYVDGRGSEDLQDRVLPLKRELRGFG